MFGLFGAMICLELYNDVTFSPLAGADYLVNFDLKFVDPRLRITPWFCENRLNLLTAITELIVGRLVSPY